MPLFEVIDDEFDFRWERREQNYKFKSWIESVFQICDENGDGVLDKDEVRKMLEQKERLEYEERVRIKGYFDATCPLPQRNEKKKQMAIENGNGFKGIDSEVFECD